MSDHLTFPETCLLCGAPFELELLDLYDDHHFTFTACCEAAYEWGVDLLNYGSKDEKLAMMRFLGVEEFAGAELRRVADDGLGVLVLDYKLHIRPIARDKARAFVAEHHTHNKPTVSWRYGAAIYNAGTLMGVAMCGRPVARMLDGKTIVEVNRVCVRRDVPDVYRWNACSMLYGWSAREAKRRGFAKIITYTLESEPAVTMRAVGWKAAARTKGGSWNRPGRARSDTAPTVPKIRWERAL